MVCFKKKLSEAWEWKFLYSWCSCETFHESGTETFMSRTCLTELISRTVTVEETGLPESVMVSISLPFLIQLLTV